MLGAALNHSALNLANALGAWLGGLVIAAGLGYRAPSVVGAGLAAAGLVPLAVSAVLRRRDAAGAGAGSARRRRRAGAGPRGLSRRLQRRCNVAAAGAAHPTRDPPGIPGFSALFRRRSARSRRRRPGKPGLSRRPA